MLTPPRVITVGKKKYLAGMTWRSFGNRPTKSDLKEECDLLGAEWISMRPVDAEIIQVGFSAKPDNSKNPGGMLSLAATVAGSRKQPWLGVFKIQENLWWYIAVRDGYTILPDGDVIGGHDEIMAARDRHSGYADWDYTDGQFDDLVSIISDVNDKPSKIAAINGSPIPPSYIAAAVALTCVAAAGGWWFHHASVQKAEAARIALMAQMKIAAQSKTASNAAEAVANSPLNVMPMPDEWLSACYNATKDIPLSSDGWALSSISCTGQSIALNWDRMPGATLDVRPAGALSENGDAVLGSITLHSGLKGVLNGKGITAGRNAFLAWAQRLGVVPSIAASTPAAPTLPGAPPAKASLVSGLDFSFPLSFLPIDLGLDDVPGLRLKGMSFDGRTWNITGVIYE